MTLIKEGLTRTIVKQFFVLSMIISAILNFPVIEEQSIAYQEYGGYIGWPILWILQRIFGENPFAIKALIVLLAIGVIIWIIWAFNIPVPRLPSVSLRSSNTGKPAMAKKAKKVEEDEEEEYEYEEEEEEGTLPVVTKKGSAIGDSLKSMLKDKIQNKIKEKEQKVIKFPKDKPTFDISLLPEGATSTFDVDQSYLEQKAIAIKGKLEEFDIPIDIK